VSEPPEPDDREPDDGLFLTDAQIIRRLGVARKIGYAAIRDLEKSVPGRPKFPAYDPLFPRRRFWPAVEKYFKLRHGVTDEPFMAAPQWQETEHAPATTGDPGGDRNAGAGVETPKDTLERLLDRAAGHRRPRLSRKKPVLVVHKGSAGVDA
jgi:hypothetical protein